MEAGTARVLEILGCGDFTHLVSTCEDVELEIQDELSPVSVATVGDGVTQSGAPPTVEGAEVAAAAASGDIITNDPEKLARAGFLYAAHLLAYLLDGQLNNARFLWKRTPPAVQQVAQAAMAHEALVARWHRRHAEYFAKLEASGSWDSGLLPLVEEVAKRGRKHLFDKLGDAYKMISSDRISDMLRLDASAVLAACDHRGWSVDEFGNVSPVPVKADEDLMQMGEAQLQKLAEYVSYLEQPTTKWT
eukprot:TRINITY_DN20563_c0_g1_i1.p1 TRINITY_DN20563_c0_g1~~TRINITY_DN20563_c0_g1_i1.p1  ORF type:complete len:247 (+),score=54.61 TRINITY_DN20563_c0_g1_i1:155-895(+)